MAVNTRKNIFANEGKSDYVIERNTIFLVYVEMLFFVYV